MKLRNKLTLGVGVAIVTLTAGVFALYCDFSFQRKNGNERGHLAVFTAEPYRGAALTWGETPDIPVDYEGIQLEVWGPRTNFYYPDR